MITTTPWGETDSYQEPAVTGSMPLVGPGGDSPGSRAPRTIWFMGGLGALALLVAGAIVWYAFRPVAVEVSIDGEVQTVDTRAGSVTELLTELGITLSDADLVEPGLDTELVEGATVTIRYARNLILVVDGVEAVHSTTSLTVGEAMEEIGTPAEGAAVSAAMEDPLPREGLTVEIVTPKAVNLTIGTEVRDVTSTEGTVGELLAAQAVELSDTDTVAPTMDTPVTAGLAVVVTRIRVENEIRTETIPHETVEQDDPEATAGSREVLTEGADGTQDVTYAVTYTNDQITSEAVVSSAVTLEPVTEVVSVGTKQLPSADLNWGALAQCESGGNPQAVNSSGGYYGLYQFSLSTWASVGGSGNPIDATPEEQTLRAQILYERSGEGQWPHCGPRLFT